MIVDRRFEKRVPDEAVGVVCDDECIVLTQRTVEDGDERDDVIVIESREDALQLALLLRELCDRLPSTSEAA